MPPFEGPRVWVCERLNVESRQVDFDVELAAGGPSQWLPSVWPLEHSVVTPRWCSPYPELYRTVDNGPVLYNPLTMQADASLLGSLRLPWDRVVLTSSELAAEHHPFWRSHMDICIDRGLPDGFDPTETGQMLPTKLLKLPLAISVALNFRLPGGVTLALRGSIADPTPSWCSSGADGSSGRNLRAALLHDLVPPDFRVESWQPSTEHLVVIDTMRVTNLNNGRRIAGYAATPASAVRTLEGVTVVWKHSAFDVPTPRALGPPPADTEEEI